MSPSEVTNSVVRMLAKEGCQTEFYVLSADWSDKDISVTVVDNESAWTGKLESDKIEVLSNTTKMKYEVYFSELTKALAKGNDCTFIIEKDEFIVKKIDAKSTIKMKFCTVPLLKVPSVPTYSSLLKRLIENNAKIKGQISNIMQEVSSLKKEREGLIKNLELYINEKTSLETMLYSKFCEVLNTKKNKIQSLETQFDIHSIQKSAENKNPEVKQECYDEEHDAVSPEDNLNPQTVISSSSSQSVLKNLESTNENLNHYNSDTDVDTDDENIEVPVISQQRKMLPAVEPNENKKRILPKRGNSSGSLNVKKKCMAVQSSFSDKNELEFNSQSLLDEY